jgi:hypothetical protein
MIFPFSIHKDTVVSQSLFGQQQASIATTTATTTKTTTATMLGTNHSMQEAGYQPGGSQRLYFPDRKRRLNLGNSWLEANCHYVVSSRICEDWKSE